MKNLEEAPYFFRRRAFLRVDLRAVFPRSEPFWLPFVDCPFLPPGFFFTKLRTPFFLTPPQSPLRF